MPDGEIRSREGRSDTPRACWGCDETVLPAVLLIVHHVTWWCPLCHALLDDSDTPSLDGEQRREVLAAIKRGKAGGDA